MTAWRIEVAPVPGLSNVATPTKPIITIPITLYGYGNGDNAEERGSRETARWAGAWGAQDCQRAMRFPALNRLHLPGSSGDFPPILHQYTSAIRPDHKARAIHWITSYAYYALCAPPRDAWLPTQPSDSVGPSTPPAPTRSLNGDYLRKKRIKHNKGSLAFSL